MGQCFGGEKKELPKEYKFLLLGAGESGKSTFHRQLRILFGEDIIEKEKLTYKNIVFSNILNTISSLCIYCLQQDEPFEEENEDKLTKLSQKIIKLVKVDKESPLINDASKVYTEDVWQACIDLWSDKKVKEALDVCKYTDHIFDGATFLLDSLERMNPEKYEVSQEDALRCRRKTTGIVEFVCNPEIEGKQHVIKLVDVGGQRNERKKWMHYFNGISALLFVCSLSDYDQKCYEDDETNRMSESLSLFEDNINNNVFRSSAIILFLNKRDVFAAKLKKSPLSALFEDYKGGDDAEAGIEFIKQKYLDCNKGDPKRIFVFITQATEKSSVEENFNEILKLVSSGKLSTQYQ